MFSLAKVSIRDWRIISDGAIWKILSEFSPVWFNFFTLNDLCNLNSFNNKIRIHNYNSSYLWKKKLWKTKTVFWLYGLVSNAIAYSLISFLLSSYFFTCFLSYKGMNCVHVVSAWFSVLSPVHRLKSYSQ